MFKFTLATTLLALATGALGYSNGTYCGCTADGDLLTNSGYVKYAYTGQTLMTTGGWGPGTLLSLTIPENPTTHNNFNAGVRNFRAKCPAAINSVTRSLPQVRSGTSTTGAGTYNNYDVGAINRLNTIFVRRWVAFPHQHNPDANTGFKEQKDSWRLRYVVPGYSYRSCYSQFFNTGAAWQNGVNDGLTNHGVAECHYSGSLGWADVAACRCSRFGSERGDTTYGARFKNTIANRLDAYGNIYAGDLIGDYDVNPATEGAFLEYYARAFNALEQQCPHTLSNGQVVYSLYRRYSCADNGIDANDWMTCAMCMWDPTQPGCTIAEETSGSTGVAGASTPESERHVAHIMARSQVEHYWYACKFESWQVNSAGVPYSGQCGTPMTFRVG